MNLLGAQHVHLVDHPAYTLNMSPRDLYPFLKNSRTALREKFPGHL
jgi:hypothetical protein